MPKPRESLAALALLALFTWASAAAQPERGTLRVGAIKYKSDEAFQGTYEPLVGFLATELGLRPVFVQVPEDRMAYELASGRHDMGVFTPFPYLKASLDFEELEVFASHVVHGNRTYRGAILLRSESGIETLADLRGRQMLFVKPTSTSGFKVPQGILLEHDIEIESDLDMIGFSGGHQESLRALLEGEAEAVAVDQAALVDLTAAERDSVRILEEYEVPYHAYVLTPGLDAGWGSRIREAMFGAHKNPDARAAFDNPLGIERWEPRQDESYNSLRRWLGLVRVKPSLQVATHAKVSALKVLKSRGDLAEYLADEIVELLRASRRFSSVETSGEDRGRRLHVDLSAVDDQFHCQLYLDEDKRIAAFDLSAASLKEQLPPAVASQTLAALPLVDRLRHNGEEWFITYGRDDGIELDEYAFRLVGGAKGESTELSNDSVTRVTAGNTFFRDVEGFSADRRLEARYRASELFEAHEVKAHEVHNGGSLADFLKANLLEVLGLAAGLLSVLVGAYVARRRKRRFRTVLADFTQLLKDHVEDKYNLDSRLYEQRAKIERYLDRGYITDSQFVILQRRLEEIHDLVRQLYAEGSQMPGDLKSEVREILKDGTVTERDYNRLLALLRSRGLSRPADSAN